MSTTTLHQTAVHHDEGHEHEHHEGNFWTRATPTCAFLNTSNVQYYSYAGAWTASTPSAVIMSASTGLPPYNITSWFTADGDGRGKLLRKNDANDLLMTITSEL